MNKFLETAFAIVMVGAAIGGCLYLINTLQQTAKSFGGGFDISSGYYLLPGSGVAGGVGEPSASTTVLYLRTSDTATSSITGFSGLSTSIDLNLMSVASTSGTSVLQYQVYFSRNRIDWFKEDCYSPDSNVQVTHGPTACIHRWVVTGAGSQTKNVSIGTTQSKYFKIDFGVTGANASLWAVAVPNEQTPN